MRCHGLIIAAVATALAAGSLAAGAQETDLTDDEVPYEEVQSGIFSGRWFETLKFSGFAAAGYIDTGDYGSDPHGTFQVREMTWFLGMNPWKDTSVFAELYVNRLGADDRARVYTGEVYVHLRNVIEKDGVELLGVKVGRVDIPFGEEYLQQDASDNPLITLSAAWPYGLDEGVLLHGDAGPVDWIAAVTNGNYVRSREDNGDKQLQFKLSGDATDFLHLSGSALFTGESHGASLGLAGTHAMPVGTSEVKSSLGVSPSTMIDSYFYEADAKLTQKRWGHVWLAWGTGEIDDQVDEFDRDVTWFTIEPLFRFNAKWYAAARYSEIGTYDDEKGYRFEGKPTAEGTDAFGDDVKRFRRVAFGIGWRPNPNVVVKGEISDDHFDLIKTSTIEEQTGRTMFGAEIVLSF